MSTQNEDETPLDAETDDEMDWEEVAVPHHLESYELDLEEGPSTKPNIEITLKARTSKGKEIPKKKTSGISHAERLVRIDCHKVHTVALLTNGWIRNKWLNDQLLHARLLSLTPLHIQNQFAMIHKSRIPEAAKRGHLFEMGVTRLVEWWANDFFEITFSGHIRSRTFDDVQAELLSKGYIDDLSPEKNKGKGKARQPNWDDYEDEDEDEGELIRSEKSLMKHALQRFGSRDVSAQLFTALCRALGIPARLVVSLQSVPWQASVGKPKTASKSRKGKEKATDSDAQDNEEDDDMEEVEISEFPGDGQRIDGGGTTSKGKAKAKGKPKYVVKLRKTKSKGQTLGSSAALKPLDPTTSPPVFWTEVFSRPDGRWLPVDPIRAIVNKRKVFDPSFSTTPNTPMRKSRVDNRMSYVIAFEEDGYVRDVTPRYAREYGAKVAKAQAGGKSRKQWWERVLSIVTRPYRLHRDDLEDDDLAANQINEGMPTTLSGFKDHPLYVLERHLHRDQIIPPNTLEIGKFRGDSVYPRGSVLDLKAAENWMRRGRTVRAGEQPMKWVKQRASTIGRKRELEVLREAGANGSADGADVMQGLYAEQQTEAYTAPPVVDGKIPKNDFGNIDLYVPSMLPAGAVHIPHKGVAKVARQLGFDFAEAVTSFEFKKGKAFPVLTGIVTAAEHEDVILEAFWEAEHTAAQKENEKRQLAIAKRWTRLVQGLRIRQRLQEQYAGDSQQAPQIVVEVSDEDGLQVAPGGFLTAADDVVQPYTLPKYQHVAFESPPHTPARLRSSAATSLLDETETPPLKGDVALQLDHHSDDGDANMADVPSINAGIHTNGTTPVPKSMAALAAEDLARSVEEGSNTAHAAGPPPRSTGARAPEPSTSAAGSKAKRGRAKRGRGAPASDGDEAAVGSEDAPPRRAKRARAARESAPAPVPASDRVLRARRGKSDARAAMEQAQEEAYRRAVAG
ncbi:Rad4-domain-containing protein [Artomyces pyxidatus]|uniref:Rad4-domain-containing protein n=1 Tax=Artomyces pyxidatus TaxID=48021 RepID=A0ACB8T7G4_9AGAM|nr:Rad4-domain-containing protein [Artomyces pyxidatus]